MFLVCLASLMVSAYLFCSQCKTITTVDSLHQQFRQMRVYPVLNLKPWESTRLWLSMEQPAELRIDGTECTFVYRFLKEKETEKL